MSLKVESEANIENEPCVLAWDTKLFVGTEDGSIKTFDAKLTPGPSWAAHAVQVFSLDAAGGKVFSASNDGGVRAWTPDGQKICDLPHSDGDIETLHVYGTNIFIGDDVGKVTVYEDNAVKAKYSVLEEVKDLQYRQPFLFTARDLYVTATEIKPDDSKTRFVTRHTMEGRAPMRIAGDKIIFVSRSGNDLKLHYATVEHEFKQLHEVKASDMIVTSIAVNGDFAWSGGWDGNVRKWKIASDQLQPAGEVNLGACINALAAGPYGVYAAVAGGKLVHVTDN